MQRVAYRSTAVLAFVLAVPAATAAQDAQQTPLRIYLDCGRCDFDHLRREVPVVDYVRDPADADVHVLVTLEETGAGGDAFTFHFLGLGALAGLADTLQYASQQVQTEDEVRDGYTRTFGVGLVRYLARTGREASVELDFGDAEDGDRQLAPESDHWNLWVFRAGVGAELQGESRRKDTALDGSFSASRTTEDFKVDVGFRGEYEEQEFELRNGSLEVSSTRELEGEGIMVWSLGPHWSWGVAGAIGSDQSVNQTLYTEAAPALEYSFYPYAESTRRQITATYRVGMQTFWYEERTIFNRISEIRPAQSLELAADFRQPWGDLVVSLEGSHLLDDPDRHRVDLFANVEVRLLRGVSLDVQGNVARIKDQIYLSASGLDDNEILIGQRELGTDFEYGVEVGLSFTFGSIFNNVVNPRLRTGGGDDFD